MNPPLTSREANLLSRWARGRGVSATVAARAALVLRCAEGRSFRDVAREAGTTRHRVRRWWRRFSTHRLEGLVDQPRPGAPSKDARERVLDGLRAGVTSTYALASRCQISQPTACRLRREVGLDPTVALPPEQRRLDPDGWVAVDVYVGAGHRVLVLTPPPASARPSPRWHDELSGARRAAAKAGRGSNVKLRRFLRDVVRTHPGPVTLIVTSRQPHGPAVAKLLERHPRLRWLDVTTDAAWTRLAHAWTGRPAAP